MVICLLLSFTGCSSDEVELGDATEHFLAAQEALDKGDQATALNELNLSIELQPDAWAYYQRAQILAEQKQFDAALADCRAGLELDPQHEQLKWLAGELRKPADRRFQGKNANPPGPKK
jgi:tetratricopeptide (TPR) repeat protein